MKTQKELRRVLALIVDYAERNKENVSLIEPSLTEIRTLLWVLE